jgi:hypothetical protein
VGAFRAVAPAGTAPLQLCALSGCADPASADHFKLGLMRAMGPAQGGIELLNLLVDVLYVLIDPRVEVQA